MKLSLPFILSLLLILATIAFAAEVEIANNGTWTGPIALTGNQYAADDYYFVIPEEQTIREVVVRMREISDTAEAGFDPDLFVKIGAPANRTRNDGSDISDSFEHTVVLRAPQFSWAPGTKVYIGLLAWRAASGSVQIQAEAHGCVALNCGGEERGICDVSNDEGVCHCKPGFTVHPNCDAQQQNLPFDTVRAASLLGGQTMYHDIVVPAAKQDGWVKVTVRRTSRSNGVVTVAIRKGGLPSDNNNVAIDTLYSVHSEISLIIPKNIYSSGTWTIGVFNGRGPLEYQIEAAVWFCENNCSGNGVCAPETSTCTCKEGWSLRKDCSVKTTDLILGDSEVISLGAWQEMYFDMPVSQALADAKLELGIHLQALNTTELSGYANFPTLFLNRKDQTPTPYNYDVVSPQPATWNQTMYLPDTKLTPGKMHVLLKNGNAAVDYLIEVRSRVHCPPGCSQHGMCDAVGHCHCFTGWIGGSCQINHEKCDIITGAQHGTKGAWVFFLFVLFAALSGGIAAFVYAKFFYVEKATAPPSELQYDPLNVN